MKKRPPPSDRLRLKDARSEKTFKKFLELAPDAMIVLDPDGKILLLNTQVEKLLGYSQSELLGQPVEKLVPNRFKSGHVGHRKQFLERAHTRTMGMGLDLFARHKKGREIPVSISLSPMETDRGVLVTASIRDITVQKHAEKILRQSKADLEDQIDQRTSEIRRLQKEILDIIEAEQRRIGQDLHDGPGQTLTAVTYMGQLLHKKLSEDKMPEAETAAEIVQHIGQVIDQLRGLARGLYPVELSRHGLASALEDLAHTTEMQCRIPCSVRSSGSFNLDQNRSIQLYRIAQEAINNAVKHARSKNIMIQIYEKHETIFLEVADDGIGIQWENPSSGMGMDIMKYRAEMIGARIEFVPQPANGTLVACTLPVHQGPKE